MIPARSPGRVVGVKRLADYLKRKLEGDAQLRSVSVRGEVSNRSVARSGHMNFDLKEGEVVLRCFAWESDLATFPPFTNGTAIVATGAVSTYAPKSSYQLVVRAVEREGVGDVHALFEERKQRLNAEGLFDPARKRPLPPFPFRVALVSSRTANGAIDFTTLLRERAPHIRVVWCETSVQGPNAPAEIVAAIGRASRADVDVIVVTRGGGSFEDLFAFSDEGVVRAVSRARHPVVSAIGHTVDQQLCDFAADVHVETPSAAAKAIGPDLRDLRGRLAERVERARTAVALRIERLERRLESAMLRSKLSEPRRFLLPLAQRVDELEASVLEKAHAVRRSREAMMRDLARRLDAHDPTRRLVVRATQLRDATQGLDRAMHARLEAAKRDVERIAMGLEPAALGAVSRASHMLALVQMQLDGNNPEEILQRGYAIVTYGDAIVRDPALVPPGALVQAKVARGTLRARVEPAVER